VPAPALAPCMSATSCFDITSAIPKLPRTLTACLRQSASPTAPRPPLLPHFPPSAKWQHLPPTAVPHSPPATSTATLTAAPPSANPRFFLSPRPLLRPPSHPAFTGTHLHFVRSSPPFPSGRLLPPIRLHPAPRRRLTHRIRAVR